MPKPLAWITSYPPLSKQALKQIEEDGETQAAMLYEYARECPKIHKLVKKVRARLTKEAPLRLDVKGKQPAPEEIALESFGAALLDMYLCFRDENPWHGAPDRWLIPLQFLVAFPGFLTLPPQPLKTAQDYDAGAWPNQPADRRKQWRDLLNSKSERVQNLSDDFTWKLKRSFEKDVRAFLAANSAYDAALYGRTVLMATFDREALTDSELKTWFERWLRQRPRRIRGKTLERGRKPASHFSGRPLRAEPITILRALQVLRSRRWKAAKEWSNRPSSTKVSSNSNHVDASIACMRAIKWLNFVDQGGLHAPDLSRGAKNGGQPKSQQITTASGESKKSSVDEGSSVARDTCI